MSLLLLYVCFSAIEAAQIYEQGTILIPENTQIIGIENIFSPKLATIQPIIKLDARTIIHDRQKSSKLKTFKSGYIKLCCGDEWQTPYNLEANVLGSYSGDQISVHHNDDVKPVVEHIEGDLKYDFRTGLHSFD